MEKMKVAHFTCTEKDDKEYIIMGFYNDDDTIYEIYNRMLNSDCFETLYISIKPVTYKNKKYVMNL